MLASCDDRTFIELFETIGPARTAKRINCAERAVFARRDRLERRLGRSIRPPDNSARAPTSLHPQRVELNVKDGIVLVASDGHYWPGEPSTAHKAFVQFCRELKPVAVIMNGDAFDGATISRHPPIGWENNPTVQQEIEVVQDRLGEIEAAAGKARKIWPLGNHDARYETRLATVAPEYARVFGVHLSDHFPLWEGCWSCWINGDVVVKHRYKGGTHAGHNNTLNAGKTTVTGHLHSLKVTPLNDYNGLRWGIETGCLADPGGPQFVDYSEDNPRNHRSGFIVLQFRGGKLMWPDVVYVVDKDHVGFRGELIRVEPCEGESSKPARATSSRAASSTRKRGRTTTRTATSRSTGAAKTKGKRRERN